MSSVDIAALGQLKPSQPLDFTKYPTPKAKTAFTLAPAGEYDLRIVTPITNDTLKVSTTGNLNLKFDAEIVGGVYNGQKVRFQNASAATFERDGVLQSMLGSLVGATGGDFPGIGEDGDPTPQVRAVESIQGKPFRAYVTWLAEDRKHGSGIKVKGMKNFPIVTDEQGTTRHQQFVEIPGAVDEQGRPARAWANLEISNYVVSR